jgi:hypothetical protein
MLTKAAGCTTSTLYHKLPESKYGWLFGLRIKRYSKVPSVGTQNALLRKCKKERMENKQFLILF